jgi:hypothetical protein
MSVLTAARPGRNDVCRCGSGRKYKHCCLAKDDDAAAAARAKAAVDVSGQLSEDAPVKTARAAQPKSAQPWKATKTRGFVPRSRTPRKVGGG